MRKILMALCTLTLIFPALSFSQTDVHNFTGGTDGATPLSDLVLDPATGLLYGTTEKGGGSAACTKGCGTVFQISTSGSDYMKVYTFEGGTGDGGNPEAGLVADASGNLYGTTYSGGTYNMGTVFKLTLSPSGGFTESLLHSFGGSKDGKNPLSELVFDASGNLYGTTFKGGTKGKGVVFEIPSSGSEFVIYNFTGGNGSEPRAGLVFDASGDLWGTTSSGGAGFGTVFALTETLDVWNESFLYSFAGPPTDFANPYAQVTIDSSGDVYGTAKFGGPGCALVASGCGGVFELTSSASFGESLVYAFTGESDGAEPIGDLNLVLDESGFSYMFGTASEGGTTGGSCGTDGCGSTYELCGVGSTCGGAMPWTEYTVFDFAGKTNGKTPAAGVYVVQPFTPADADPRIPPPGHGGCPSGCVMSASDGGSSGDGVADTSP
jgi:uncharacterized repeat protein (TIGR03803 family)